MYIPKHFEVQDDEQVFDFIKANAFGQLVSNSQGRICSTLMPFLLSEDRSQLIGHLAKQNPQHQGIDGQEVMVSLQGPHGYISPSWYEGPGVPTWNYQAVHLYGHARVFSDTDQLKAVVDSLTDIYESGFESPWQPDYNAAMLRGIVGVEITLTDIQCKYKLSQNRSAKDQTQVIDQLEQTGYAELASAMRNLRG